MEVQKWETPVKNATGTARSSVPTAKGAARSAITPAGGVMAAVGCNALSAAALAAMSSAGASDLVDAARAYVALYDAWWTSVMRGPYNGKRDAEHWELVHERQLAWQRYADLLRAHGLEPPDRRAFAKALALGGVA